MKHLLCFAILLGWSCMELVAVPVRLLTRPAADSASAHEVILRLVPGGGASEASASRTLRMPVPGEAVMDLQAGVLWQVTTESQEIWTPPQWIAPGEGDGNELVTLRMFPAAALTGTLVAGDGEGIPPAVDLRLEPSPGEPGLRLPPTPLQCPVQDRSFRCTVPAGRLDVRIKAGTSIPVYLWDLETRPGEARDLGSLVLKTGTSLVGWVRTADGKGLGGALVRVEPQVAGMPDDSGMEARLAEEEPASLRLVLQRRLLIQGRVFSTHGPVPGAQILARSDLNEAGAGSGDDAVTGPAGEFEVRLPRSSRQLHLTVIAMGYPIRMLALPLGSEAVVEIPLEPVGGTLVVDLGEKNLQEVLEQRAGLLAHGGTFVPFGQVARWARLLRAPQGDPHRLVVPNVEPGEYVLCFGTASQTAFLRGAEAAGSPCRRGTLAPLGELTLSLP